MSTVNYVTLGNDCSPAAALRNLKLREFALPFDWVQSSVASIQQCIAGDFEKFHTNLRFNHNKTRMVDGYGLEFPHDYPLGNDEAHAVGEGVIGEEPGKCISESWADHYDTVKGKYDRRIERFRTIMKDPSPIIVLCRYSTQDVLNLQRVIAAYYKKDNVYFVNSVRTSFKNDRVVTVYTEQNGVWNDPSVWKQGIDMVLSYL